jgi:DNA-binding PadR family transcriptional regulator
MTAQKEFQAYLPLSEATFLILLSLAPEPKHGYAIMKDVQAISDNRVILSTGTLYCAIKRLLEHEWIIRVSDPAGNETSRGRKAYALTYLGRRILEAEIDRLATLVNIARPRALPESP